MPTTISGATGIDKVENNAKMPVGSVIQTVHGNLSLPT